MSVRSLLSAVVIATAIPVVLAAPAHASCHIFGIKVSPSSVNEGSSVTVTIDRDGAVSDSSVRLTSVNGSAQANTDFPAVDEKVEFTGEQIEKSVQVATTNDALMENSETFQLKLSGGTGCSGGPFEYGGPVTVTIKASDQQIVQPSPSPSKSPPKSIAPAPSKSPTPAAAPTSASPSAAATSAAPAATAPEESDSPTGSPVPANVGNLGIGDSDDGLGLALPLAIGLAGLGLGIGGLVYLRRR